MASLRRCGELVEASILEFAEVKEVLSLAFRREREVDAEWNKVTT